MSYTLATVRTKVREILREFYDIDTVATGGIDASSETLPVSNISRYNVEDILQIENEILKMRAVLDSSSSPGTLTVTRGFLASTAAAHLISVAIHIFPEFTDRALNSAINSAIADTFDRHGGIWIETIDETLVSDQSVQEYDIPVGFTNIARIQIKDDNGIFQEIRNWELIGTDIQFQRPLPYDAAVIRLIGTSYETLKTADTNAFSLADEQVEFIIWDAVWFAIQQRFAGRIKATEYAASVNERAGQPNEMISMVRAIRDTVDRIRVREFKGRMSEFAPGPRR